ncbi:hypothetical protein EJ04DRAFT_517406 [Polyplosphaeria fusca]|uniref:Uncharacterized protein n=1 Tax=Polyplosphaeria fusca TaxID=682080 RepID=A0A9P4QH56_9PLEO|nr:hypothetical protein EJ04DRAFT_517406 [Polyplosphaeria fusca]
MNEDQQQPHSGFESASVEQIDKEDVDAPHTRDDTQSTASDSEPEEDPTPLERISQEQFNEGRVRRFGTTNPERMEVPFWDAMVEARISAWGARMRFTKKSEVGSDSEAQSGGLDQEQLNESGEESKKEDVELQVDKTSKEEDTELQVDEKATIQVESKEADDEGPLISEVKESIFGSPIWCFSRFGQSTTKLPHGTLVYIGGEHEDWYDPDFLIFNDVVVMERSAGKMDGIAKPRREFTIYGYPEEVFPPTDFHTATFVPSLNAIVIIGNIGYGTIARKAMRDEGQTPVYRLDVGTWKMTEIETEGDCPSGICRHEAALESDGAAPIIRVRGTEDHPYLSATTRYMVRDGEEVSVEVDHNETWTLDVFEKKWKKEMLGNVTGDEGVGETKPGDEGVGET